ncbi:alcohol dehydrogenase catalytic domain-containing protein [Streptomyces spiralis]|uniref:alcohol dehydrogenase catalytic domain-containing protein n=1 Tax=Streptomyces spiralis TaxID=66376 RepID=UPI0036B1449C
MDSSTQMNAVTVPEFGGAEVLRVARRPVPEPGPGQVAVDVAYAGANFAEILYRRCVVDVPLPFVPGIEVAGRIRAVGEGGRAPGRRAAGGGAHDRRQRGLREVAVTSADLVAPLDGLSLSMEVAAAVAAP